MNYYIQFKNYNCYLLGEKHDQKDDHIKNFVQEYASNAILLLEAPYHIQKESVKHNFLYQDNSQILSLQDKYRECLFCYKNTCPKYLFHVDIRCCDIGEKYLAKELISQLADYQHSHSLDNHLINLINNELVIYLQGIFNNNYNYDITNKWSKYLSRKDSNCYILHDKKHPLAYYHEQLNYVNPKLANKIYQNWVLESEKILAQLDRNNSLSYLACLIVDTLIMYQLILLDNCDPLDCQNILVVVGSYHVTQLKKYLTIFNYSIDELY